MLKPSEPFLQQSAFIINLFDNDQPDLPGNALIRYRVLEYFHTNTDLRDLFDIYFRALGVGAEAARAVVADFVNAGFLKEDLRFDTDTGRVEAAGARVTIAGRCLFRVARNLWYGICIKTGMYIEAAMIRHGDEAVQMARSEAQIDNESLLGFYKHSGWVSDSDLIEFLWHQAELEATRRREFLEAEPGLAQQLAALFASLSRPEEVLGYAYGQQLDAWRRRKQPQGAEIDG